MKRDHSALGRHRQREEETRNEGTGCQGAAPNTVERSSSDEPLGPRGWPRRPRGERGGKSMRGARRRQTSAGPPPRCWPARALRPGVAVAAGSGRWTRMAQWNAEPKRKAEGGLGSGSSVEAEALGPGPAPDQSSGGARDRWALPASVPALGLAAAAGELP